MDFGIVVQYPSGYMEVWYLVSEKRVPFFNDCGYRFLDESTIYPKTYKIGIYECKGQTCENVNIILEGMKISYEFEKNNRG